MWPILLDMTRDDCRRTLRRLELEAYSSMISVFRAQGALADDRKKLLEDLRSALNISGDRHTAEARRASNDELLATIADQLSGPNTGLGWTCEGRRRIPILPRGIPQTMYTAIADKAASLAAEENDKIAQNAVLEQQKVHPISPKSPVDALQDMELEESSAATGDAAGNTSCKNNAEGNYPPVVMWDQSLKVANDEAPPRKRSRSDSTTPHHNRTSRQKYLNMSQFYSNYSKTPSGKSSNQYGKNSYIQMVKFPGKSNLSQMFDSTASKHRSIRTKHGNGGKHTGQVAIPHHQVRSGIKSPTDPHIPGSQALNIQNPIDSNTLKSQTSGYQANFAQSIAQIMTSDETNNDMKKSNICSSFLESPTSQVQGHTLQLQEMASLPSPSQPSPGADASSSTVAPGTPVTVPPYASADTPSPHLKIQSNTSGKSCHLIIKKNTDSPGDSSLSSPKIQVSSMQIISKPSEISGIKVLQNRQVMVTPAHNSSQKIINAGGKLITTKLVQQIPQKAQTQISPNVSKSQTVNAAMEKVLIVSKPPMSSSGQPSILQRSLSNTSKNIIISGHNTNPSGKDRDPANLINKSPDGDALLSKGVVINNSEMKLSTKTFLLNPKSGQKMVVLPKSRAKGSLIGQVPLLQVKGMQGRSTMKLVPVSSSGQVMNNQSKPSNVTVVSKAANSNISLVGTKIMTKDSTSHIKPNFSISENTVNKLSTGVQITPKSACQAILRPAGLKSNVYVVQQKGAPLTKGALKFTKNGNDLSKIVMSHKLVSPVTPQQTTSLSIPTSVPSVSEASSKNSGNVIILEMSNDQLEQGSNLSDFFDEGSATALIPSDDIVKVDHAIITEDTPVLFHNQISGESCNADSMESTTDSLMEVAHIDDTMKSSDSFCEEQPMAKIASGGKVSIEDQAASSLESNWHMETDDGSDKHKISNMSELNMELEMSSDSETGDYNIASSQDESKKNDLAVQEDEIHQTDQETTDETNEMFVQHSSIGQASRTLLSQLQDEGSSSNDSPFVLAKNLGKTGRLLSKFKVQTESNAQLSLRDTSCKNITRESKEENSCNRPITDMPSAQTCSVNNQSRPGRMDIFSTAIASADINLETFEYLEDGIMSGEDVFNLAGGDHGKKAPDAEAPARKEGLGRSLQQQLEQLLAHDHLDEATLDTTDSSQTSGAME